MVHTAPIETLRIVSATYDIIEAHRDSIVFCMAGLLPTRPELIEATHQRSYKKFATNLLDAILEFATTAAIAQSQAFMANVSNAGDQFAAALEAVLRTSLATGLGDFAKPILLNAWVEAFKILFEQTRRATGGSVV